MTRLLPLLGTLLALVVPATRAVAQTEEPEPIELASSSWLAVALDVPIHDYVAVSPDDRYFVALQTRPRPVMWIVPREHGEPFALRDDWAAYLPRWAPSGDRIGFIAGIGPPRVWTVEMDPRSARPMAPPRLLIRTPANAFAFGPDGDRIALVWARSTRGGASQVRIIDWETRATRILLNEDGLIYWVDWSPDGAFLYYGLDRGDGPHLLRRARVRDGRRETLRAVGEFLGLSPDGQAVLYRPVTASSDPDQALGESQRDRDQKREPDDGGLARGTEAPEGGDPRTIVHVAGVEGGPILRITLPATSTPRWGSSSARLMQVRHGERHEMHEIAGAPCDRIEYLCVAEPTEDDSAEGPS